MTTTQLALVDFQGQQLLSMRQDEEVRVAVRPICDALGLDWSSQLQRLKRDAILSEGVAMMATPSGGGVQESVTLPLDMLNGWLFGIDSGKVKPELRDKVIAYQRECYRVLHAYWSGAPAARPAALANLGRSYRDMIGLAEKLTGTGNNATRTMIYTMLGQIGGAIDIPVPPIEAFVPPALPATPDLAVPFFFSLWRLSNLCVDWNHSRNSNVLAVNLNQAADLFAANGFPLRIDQPLKTALAASTAPAWLGTKSVNSVITGRALHCWTFAGPLPDMRASD